jgi:hypothetical protein
MGNSPRGVPSHYSQTINNNKKVLRWDIYTRLAEYDKSYKIVDFDLVSGYTSILVGLYRNVFEALQQAIEVDGLWNFIKGEFKKNGVEHHFDKPAVKICVYSPFFLGGNKAMNEGILESIQRDTGMTKVEFDQSKEKEIGYEIAHRVTDQMQNSAIIRDFRSIAEKGKTDNWNSYLIPQVTNGILMIQRSNQLIQISSKVMSFIS